MSDLTRRLTICTALAGWLAAAPAEGGDDPPPPADAGPAPAAPAAPSPERAPSSHVVPATAVPEPGDADADAEAEADADADAAADAGEALPDEFPAELETAAPSSLQIFGFADMSVHRFWMGGPSSVYRQYVRPEAAFAMGRINVYLRSEPTPRLSSLLEVRLLYAPDNTSTVLPTGQVETTSTDVLDDTEVGGYLRWGALSIQRAHLDYQVTDRVTVRVGHWLTPYGIWNVDHGSPTVIGVRRPFVINASLFPESQLGVLVTGTTPVGASTLTWTATVSNGRIASIADDDLDKAVGARVELARPELDELRIGVSGYGALEHAYDYRVVATVPSDPATAVVLRTGAGSARQLSLGADLRIRTGRWRLLAEGVVRQRVFGDTRPLAVLPRRGGFEPDELTYGYYLIGGYQSGYRAAMPYLQLEGVAGTQQNSQVQLAQVGVNLRPEPTLTVKVGAGLGRIIADGPALAPSIRMAMVEAQVAWVFR